MAPAFPYPSDHWLGQPSSDDRNHSGCYGGVDQTNVRTWQDKMRARGWSIGVDGCFGPESESVCRSFQAEKGLTVDGDVGPQTWKATWDAPVTGGGGGSSSSGGGGGGGSAPASGTRQDALDWMAAHRSMTEQPAGSNCDDRKDGIRAAQDRCVAHGSSGTWLRNEPWCGVWCCAALEAAGVDGLSYNLASVAWIEDRARAGGAPFTGWTTNGDNAEPGDLVVMFGYGGHVGMLRSVDSSSSITTEEGNTSDTSAKRTRSRSSDVRGYARVRY
jgi:hypothetical protein